LILASLITTPAYRANRTTKQSIPAFAEGAHCTNSTGSFPPTIRREKGITAMKKGSLAPLISLMTIEKSED
jgi:hypothetical protein